MEDNRFFKSVWRFNAVIFMAAGILAIGIMVFAGLKIIQDITRDRTKRNIVNIDKTGAIDEKWEVGSLYKIKGTPYATLSLKTAQKYEMASYSKSTNSVRNYLFIDTRTNQGHWLFNTNEYLVTDIDYLSEKEYDEEERKVRAILYFVIEKDTNGDKRLTDKDDMTLAISLPSGQSYKKILTGVDKLVGHLIINQERMLLVYQKDGIGYTANLSLSDFEIHNEKEVPSLKNP